MTAEIHHLHTGIVLPDPEEPDELLIEFLERRLKEAKSGELRGIAVVGTYRDGIGAAKAAGLWEANQLIGQLEVFKAELVADRLVWLHGEDADGDPAG